jgi:16S rRNA (uracil1498-N3)-methyltransferase
MQHDQTHLFSLFVPSLKLNSWTFDQLVILSDADLIHRLSKVLRFSVGDQLVFFDTEFFCNVVIQEISKKNITIQVQTIQKHEPLSPQITFFLPLLKKEALEQAVYSLCELGINKIQLVITQKSRQSLLHDKEFIRLQNIVIAAAEQSKNYSVAQLVAPKKLSELIQDLSSNSFNILFDPQGASFFDLREPMKLKKDKAICLLVGPEGGLTQQELLFVQKSEFVLCALTPTILTAVQAVALGAGLIRLK